MTKMMEENLTAEIETYLKSIDDTEENIIKLSKVSKKNSNSREKIISLLREDGRLSAVALAKKIGITAKAVEKHLARLKSDGIIQRIGPAKGGHWVVNDK